MVSTETIELQGYLFTAVTVHLPKTTLLTISNERGYIMCGALDVGLLNSKLANYMSVIGTDTGANRELIDDLMIYPLHDVDRLAELLRLLIDDEKLLNRTGLNNRIKSEFFDSVKNAKEIMEIYLQLLEGC